LFAFSAAEDCAAMDASFATIDASRAASDAACAVSAFVSAVSAFACAVAALAAEVDPSAAFVVAVDAEVAALFAWVVARATCAVAKVTWAAPLVVASDAEFPLATLLASDATADAAASEAFVDAVEAEDAEVTLAARASALYWFTVASEPLAEAELAAAFDWLRAAAVAEEAAFATAASIAFICVFVIPELL
jgi:hypothetical protein